MNPEILAIINKAKDRFVVISATGGYFGSLLYRVIAASDNKFVWKRSFSRPEGGPVEWPKITEGFEIYDKDPFKESHLCTAHIAHDLIENIKTPDHLIKNIEKNKILLLKTHDTEIHEKIDSKIIRACNPLPNWLPSNSKIRRNEDISPVLLNNVHNVHLDNFLNTDFDKFINEYINMCDFLDCEVNINNVRSFILLLIEKYKRFKLTLS